MPREKKAFDDNVWCRCHSATKEALQKRADLFRVDLSDIVRWGINWAAHAPASELLSMAEASGEEQE